MTDVVMAAYDANLEEKILIICSQASDFKDEGKAVALTFIYF